MTKRKENAQSATGYDSENEIPEIKKQFIPIRDEAERGLCNSIAQEMEREDSLGYPSIQQQKMKEQESARKKMKQQEPSQIKEKLPDPITNYDVDETFFLMDEDGAPPLPSPQINDISDMSDEETSPNPDTGDGPYSRFLVRYYRYQGKQPAASSPTTTDADLEETSDLTPTEHEALSPQQKLEQDPTASAPLERGKSSDTQGLSSDEDQSPFPLLLHLTPNYNITDEEELGPSDLALPPAINACQPGLNTDLGQGYTSPQYQAEMLLAGEAGGTPGCLEELDAGFEQCLLG